MGAEINGKPVGTQSRFTCFSFAPTKHVPSCAGGVLVYADGSLTNELRELSDLGLQVNTHQRSVVSGVGPANVVQRVGYRYRMNDISAAIAVAQFQHLHDIVQCRSALVERYVSNLSTVESCELLGVPEQVKPSWYIMPLRVPAAMRDGLRAHLARAGIDTSVHYPSLLEQPAFRGMPGSAPIASREALRLISLPLYSTMTEEDVDHVCSVVSDFFSG
jgi:dTDP-4-amino-4,6-dideoxygalactose transaminase